MFKKFIVSIALVLGSLGVSAADLKIGVVDFSVVESKAPQMKTIMEKLEAQFKEKQESLIALQKKGKELQDKARKEEMTLTFADKLKYKRQLEQIDAEFNLQKKFLDEDFALARNMEMKKVQVKIMEAVQKVASNEKLDLVVRSDMVLHASQSVNITDKVIAIISNPAG
ncbi:OmpH family outer membrane protein [Aliikangiella sp. G2MR2-5]|uniref:OmpH family outer membrane protein n=1 Tax=Aliikangiella sp. G2MR2-5 TaxID=2788943 RepID=UPI0018AB4EB4|nr:OmpH family outer membrane protein [Aliikangiella sp. G2MR2-5]